MKVFSGGNLSEIYTRSDIQDMLYDAFGIDKSQVAPSYRDNMNFSFSLQQVNEMGEDEFHHYFTLDPRLIDKNPPKSSFKEANKKMKAIEEKSKDVVSKMSAVTKSLTYENYLKSVTPKSSFKEANKKMKAIEDAGN
jgi:hypothetical protein